MVFNATFNNVSVTEGTAWFLHFPLFRHRKHDGTGKLIFFIRGGKD